MSGSGLAAGLRPASRLEGMLMKLAEFRAPPWSLTPPEAKEAFDVPDGVTIAAWAVPTESARTVPASSLNDQRWISPGG